jgi:hypothetical protein
VEVSSLLSTLNSNVNTANMSSSPILIGKVGDKEGANQ